MAQRRSSYPISPPADPSGRAQREWHSSQGRRHIEVGPDGLDDPYPFASANITQTTVEQSTSPRELVESPSSLATSQQQLNEYRAQPARDLDHRKAFTKGLLTAHFGKKRISPVLEESTTRTSPILLVAPITTSTESESGHTSRGGMAPAAIAHTPSYPFPRMADCTPHQIPSYLPYQDASPSSRQQTSPAFQNRGLLAKVLLETPTPPFALPFDPPRVSNGPRSFHFPTPNLYDLSLMLSAEPGMDAWWNTVVQIMRDIYKAERVTLAIPADTTDIENVPWGQKATYNEHHGDDLSLGYLAKASGAFRNSDYEASDGLASFDNTTANSTILSQPDLRSRHSFTAFEEDKRKSQNRYATIPPKRPAHLTRSKTQYPSPRVAAGLDDDYTKLSKHALDEHNAAAETVQEIPCWEAAFMARYEGQGQVLPILQALDNEADPLIDHTCIMRVLECGRPVALTRTYPYLPRAKPDSEHGANQNPRSKESGTTNSKWLRRQRSDSSSKSLPLFASTSHGKGNTGDKPKTIVSSLDDEDPRTSDPKYEEYEQASPSTSPVVRVDPKDNPFFTDAMVDEDSLNPGSPPSSYTGVRPPEGIDVDKSWTVLHIPLAHVLLSKPSRAFRLDATALQQKIQSQAKDECLPGRRGPSEVDRVLEQSKRNRPAPIAIISILSPIIPYPSKLRHSLEDLAPHMATSLSLCRHYSNLETELAGIHRRRPLITGFGAVAAFGSHFESDAYLAPGHASQQNTLGGSITSPSVSSAISRSATVSPLPTPEGSRNHFADRRQPLGSPSAGSQGAQSYLANKQTRALKQNTLTPGTQRPQIDSKANSPSENRHSFPPGVRFGNEAWSQEPIADRSYFEPRKSTMKAQGDASSSSGNNGGVPDSSREVAPANLRNLGRVDHGHSHHGHTVLHSYGADFASTFQSLPPSSSLSARMSSASAAPTRSGPLTSRAGDMPPPSDRLKSLILDSLPAHVFVSLPQTGETVWVNSRFLSYRGQTVAELSADPWGNIHCDDKEGYLEAWGHSLRTGEQFSRTVRIKRFDGAYRWFHARAVASKDKRGVIMQFLGSYMDIHDQHIAELKAARQEEIEASEGKHRLLANLIPQIIFTATEGDGITFANDQWLSYTGQRFEDSLGLGFMDFVHPDDLSRCRILIDRNSKSPNAHTTPEDKGNSGASSSGTTPTPTAARTVSQPLPHTSAGKWALRDMQPALSGASSSGSESIYSLQSTELTELAQKSIIKASTDANGRLSYTTEVRLRAKTGEYRWHLIRCVEIDTVDFGHGASSYFGSATDINDHKLLEAKLKEAMESKGRFLSNMSHEIRTPLMGISGMVSFLQDTTLDEEQRDYTNTIQTSANSLIMIINDILDLSKADAGMMKLKHEWFHTRSLIEDVNELVSTIAIAKRLDLNYLVEADVPAWVKGDKVRIRQVLLNVIGNAIKFTAEGEVFSRCKVYADEDPTLRNEGEIMLQFAITDTGRGFSKDEAELIFKPFSQIDGSSTRQHGGSGLGLVISRRLVELHDGKMEGTAIPGKGSTFTFTARFTLPSAEDHPSSLATSGSAAASASTGSRQGSFEAVPRTGKNTSAVGELRSIPKDGFCLKGTEENLSPSSTNISSSSASSSRLPSHITGLSSVISDDYGLAWFSETAKANGQDMYQVELRMPSDRSSPPRALTPDVKSPRPTSGLRVSLYSILIICPQHHSREATTQHIEMTLPKDIPHRITAIGTIEEARPFIGGDDPARFTHIVLNLPSAEAIINAMDQIVKSQKIEGTTILILSDPVQRKTVQKLAANTQYERSLSGNLVTFIYKPVKPSRFAFVFDPDKLRDLSTDRNRSTAQQMVENQKASYQEIEKRVGNKGYRVLVVEDNLVNQKVLNKYLKKIGVEVEVAVDGVECTETVLPKPHEYYSLILCDLHMPRKDGYQACREIREWEKASKLPKLPIIALSANVMSDVQEKCVAAGFSDYVTKPVDFIDLSRAMAQFFK